MVHSNSSLKAGNRNVHIWKVQMTHTLPEQMKIGEKRLQINSKMVIESFVDIFIAISEL